MSSRALLFLADAVFVLHVLVALAITGGLAAVWLGRALGWRWVRILWLRAAHLGLMAVVALEAVLGLACPLTGLEDALRRAAGTPGRYTTAWLEFWARRVFYWDLPGWVFVAAYLAFLAAILATWRLVPPRPWRRDRGRSGNSRRPTG